MSEWRVEKGLVDGRERDGVASMAARAGEERSVVTLKWLEERWQILLPALASLGGEQEEQIKGICAAEIDAWRGRPSMKQEKSLRTPLTETRNRIRETFELTQDNCWCNPKSGEREHLSLKYLNFSSQEWIDQTLPSPVDCGIAVERHWLCSRAEGEMQESGW
jgi:hypothetical protein